MLQQTQVDRVLPKYEEWLTRYPSLDALAGADEADVVQTWRPLGYNIRPRRLQAIAREAVERYDGRLPSDEATLRSFKGIGPYTAGAIMSFAFRQRAAIVDTNVARVLYRIFVGGGDPKAHAMKAHLWERVARGAAAPARLRLQPGADGFRRDGVLGAQAAVRGVPDGARLRHRRVSSATSPASASGSGRLASSDALTQRSSCPSSGRGSPSIVQS